MNRDKGVAAPSAVAVLLSLSLAAGGCGSSPEQRGDAASTLAQPDGGEASPADHSGGGSPIPFIQIQSAIADGTTNAGQGPFAVSFYGAARTLDANTLSALLSRLQMLTWPEGVSISVTATLDATSDLTQATAQVAVGAPLESRWYSLSFGPQEAGLVSQQTFDGGVWGVRLRPDSHPVVHDAMFCGAEAPGMKFIVKFSEPVTIERAAEALTVQQGGATLTCRLDDVQAAEVHQFCATLTRGPATVTLAAGTVRGPDGVYLAPQVWSVDIATLPLLETGCNGYRVPL